MWKVHANLEMRTHLELIRTKNILIVLDALLVWDQPAVEVVLLVQGKVDQDVLLDAPLELEGALATQINNLKIKKNIIWCYSHGSNHMLYFRYVLYGFTVFIQCKGKIMQKQEL